MLQRIFLDCNHKRKSSPMTFFFRILFITLVSCSLAFSQAPEAGIIDQLGEYIDSDNTFLNADGDTVLLKDLIDRPTVISFVYYRCPGICTPILDGLRRSLDKVQLEPGKDFRAITISINEDETPELAQEKKFNYMKGLKREYPEQYWNWLVGDSLSIAKVTQSVGFGFKRTGDDFAHGAALIVVSGEGKIARYLYGVSFNHFDLKLAILEASEGRVGPTIAKVIKFCFSYDPKGRTYVFDVLKVAGVATLLCALAFIAFLTIKTKQSKLAKGS